MIQLTRLNNHPFLLNSDLIKWIENAPDTVLTLVTGEKVVVSESERRSAWKKSWSFAGKFSGTRARQLQLSRGRFACRDRFLAS